jgi:hypothetical protein
MTMMSAFFGTILAFWAGHLTMLTISVATFGVLGYLGFRSAR